MRIGEILLADGVLGARDLDAALSDQVVTRATEQATGGGTASRLGSLLYRRGMVPSDVIARALARQHAVPAALARHLEQRDPALAALIPTELARRFVVLPVAQTRGEDGALALIVCMRDPDDPAAIALLRRAARTAIVPAVACEAVLAPLVASVYAQAVTSAPAGSGDAVEEFDVNLDDTGPILDEPIARPDPLDPLDPFGSGRFQLVGLDDQGVARDETQVAPSTTQRPSGRVGVPAAPTDTPTLDAALSRIAQSGHRDAIADAAIAYLAARWSCAVVMVVRDGVALGHRGFGGALTPAAVESIVVPLNQPSVLRAAHDRKAPYIGPPTETSVVQDRFLRVTGWSPGREVVVVPVALGGRVVCLVFAHGPLPGRVADAGHAELRMLAAAMESSFLRLIRQTKQQ